MAKQPQLLREAVLARLTCARPIENLGVALAFVKGPSACRISRASRNNFVLHIARRLCVPCFVDSVLCRPCLVQLWYH